MFRRIVFLLLALLLTAPLAAQNLPPDYAIRNIRSRFAENNQQAQIQFEVWNIGGLASAPSTAVLTVIATGQQVATDVVPPLQAQQIVTVTLTFPVAMFPPNSVQSFRAAIGVGEVEAPGSANVQSNFAQITVTFPESPTPISPTSAAPVTTPSLQKDVLTEFLNSLGVSVDLNDRTQLAVLAGIVGALVILILLLVEIIRLLFQRPPDFGNWQPPYANMPFIDPNSQAGRRQQWQLHAQNSSLPGDFAEGDLHARKLALGSDGQHLAGWRVTAVRISHYDQYGRINRSQVIASRKVVNQVNSVIRRRKKLSPEKMTRLLRSAATQLLKPFRKKLNERNVMLPLILDVRLEGKYGETRILFELYQCQNRRWRRIDQWEPDMAVISKTIRESATYTLFGMHAGETLKSFRKRLVDDLTQTLVEMVVPRMDDDQQDSKPTNPHLEPVAAE